MNNGGGDGETAYGGRWLGEERAWNASIDTAIDILVRAGLWEDRVVPHMSQTSICDAADSCPDLF